MKLLPLLFSVCFLISCGDKVRISKKSPLTNESIASQELEISLLPSPIVAVSIETEVNEETIDSLLTSRFNEVFGPGNYVRNVVDLGVEDFCHYQLEFSGIELAGMRYNQLIDMLGYDTTTVQQLPRTHTTGAKVYTAPKEDIDRAIPHKGNAMIQIITGLK